MARLIATAIFIALPGGAFAATSNEEADAVALFSAAGMEASVHDMKCFSQCNDRFSACFKDKETGCAGAFKTFGTCMGWNAIIGKKDWENEVACFIPDNVLRDQALYCLLEEYKCITIDATNATAKYPPSRDKELSGHASFKMDHLLGEWYKVQGFKLGEPIECYPCSSMSFAPYTAGAVPWPTKEPEDLSKSLIFTSYLTLNDTHGKPQKLNQSAIFGPRPNGAGYPSKDLNYGFMFGLMFYENYTVVHDGSQEAEPFVLFYVWGETLSGEYPAGFTIGKTPTASPSLKKRMAEVVTQNGFKPSDWCDVDNACFESEQQQAALVPEAGPALMI